MKAITIKNDLKFRTEIELILLCKGATRVDEDKCNDRYILSGKKNTLNIHIDNNIGSTVYSVYCKFNDCNELTGAYNSKHNFHMFSDNAIELIISDFNKFINQCMKYIN